MGNASSGVSPRLCRLIKDDQIFKDLLVISETNLSIDMGEERRVGDPYKTKYKLHLCNKLMTGAVLLFPHYDHPGMKTLYTSQYKRFTSLQRDINSRLKDAPDAGVAHAHRIFNQMVVCWGDYTYKLTGLDRGNVYFLWATQVRGVTGNARTKLYVKPGGDGVPVIVVTDGHYKPISIFPIHPGEIIANSHRARPTLLDPSKSKIFWHEDDILFVLDKPRPKGSTVNIKRKTALEVKSAVNEYASPSIEALEEEDNFLEEDSDEDVDEEGTLGAPPIELVRGTALSKTLSITTMGERVQGTPINYSSSANVDNGKQEESEESEEAIVWTGPPSTAPGVVLMTPLKNHGFEKDLGEH